MKRSNKHLSLSVIFSTAIALTGCLANPGNQNSSYNSTPNTGYNSYNSSSAPQVNIDDLRSGSEEHARQQLYARGFNEVGNNLWSNNRTNQCYQVIAANGRISTIVGRNAQECGGASAPNTGYNNNQNYNQNQNPNYNQNPGYNNSGAQPVLGQTPVALNDFVGSRAGQAEGDLVRRGYVLRKTAGLNSFWEETSSGGCVSIITNDGRYQSLVYTAPQACR